jgi:uncharacterized protein YabN with tetrapyrrole methylase and pyrophosphatase domain
MDKFKALLEVADKLNGPEGCPWDRKQTFLSLQSYVLEEAHEVVEAVDKNDDGKIMEELGDLLYTIVFYGKLAEKEGRFSIWDVIDAAREKLVRRHPHVFGDLQLETAEEVMHRWEKIKSEEKGHEQRKSALDGIPPTLPSLAKAQKMIKKILKTASPVFSERNVSAATEQEIGEEMIEIILNAEKGGIDIESAFRRTLSKYENQFRAWEENNPSNIQ